MVTLLPGAWSSSTLCSYILVGITVEKSEAPNEAAIKYFLLASFRFGADAVRDQL